MRRFRFPHGWARAQWRAYVTAANLLLLLLIWRLADFIQELGDGAVKMSLGDLHLSGWPAAAAQAIIIGALVALQHLALQRRSASTRKA